MNFCRVQRTEIYNEKLASYFIYSKIISQCFFIVFGVVSVKLAKIQGGQIADTFFLAPHVLFDSMIASYFGYKVTGSVMQRLKIKFNGQFLFTRYLSSTFPGEVVFSLIFTVMSFSSKGSFLEIVNIFVGLISVKFFLSIIFSFLVIPITNLIKYFVKTDGNNLSISSVQFK